MSKTPPRASAGKIAQSAWITIGEFRVRPFIHEDNLFAAATVQRLTREGLAGRSIIEKVARTNWLTFGTMAASLNDRGIHALVDGACSCGFGLEIARVAGAEHVTSAEYEEVLFALPGHLETKTLQAAKCDLVRGYIDWPARRHMQQDAGDLVETRWHCVICGDFAIVQMGVNGPSFWISHILCAEHQAILDAGMQPTIWRAAQLEQLPKKRDLAFAIAASAVPLVSAPITENKQPNEGSN